MHSHVVAPSSEKEQVAALVVTGKISTSTMWRTVGAVPFNSQVVFKAQAEQHAAYAPPRQKKEQCARDKAEAIAAAVSARAKRGAAGDDKLDLKAVVKFTHIVLGKTGFSKFNTKVLCLQFLAAVSPAWDTLLPAVSESGAPAPAPPAAAPRTRTRRASSFPHTTSRHNSAPLD